MATQWRGPADPVQAALLGRAPQSKATTRVDDPWSSARYPLMQFVQDAWHIVRPGQGYIHGWHTQAICLHLEAVARRDIRRLLINVPMRSSKSTILAVFFQAWAWITHPETSFLVTSYKESLALRDSVACRTLLRSGWYKERWGDRFRLSGDMNIKSRFENDKGGYRVTAAVGGATGEGADVLICLPADQRILTDHGWIYIGDIVEKHLDVCIATFDHEESCISFNPILQYFRRAVTGDGGDVISHMLYNIETASGTCIQLTGNHPVYTVEHGYIPAHHVSIGDTVLSASNLPATTTAMRLLRPSIHDIRRPSAYCQSEQSFLCKEVPWSMECGRAKPCQWQDEDLYLPNMQGRLYSAGFQQAQSALLFTDMSCHSSTGGSFAGRNSHSMHGMWQRHSLRSMAYSQTQKNLLPPRLCSPGPSWGIVWGKEWQICPWQEHPEISSRFYRDAEAENSGPRQAMRGMPDATGEKCRDNRQSTRCASCRLQQTMQYGRQSCGTLQMVSWKDAWEPEKSACLDEAPPSLPHYETVVAAYPVKRATVVYNLEVATHNNYFAEGILLHNCDDLHSRTEELSSTRAQIDVAKNYFNMEFSSCLSDPQNSCIVVSGQRVSLDDVSADILAKGGWEHLKIRQEYVPPPPGEPKPCTSIGWSDPRTELGELMWPVRWGPTQVATAKKELSRNYYAFHQQDPEASGGTLFKDDWWKVYTEWPDMNAFKKIIHTWDMRFKDDKEEGSFVVGECWGLSPNGMNAFLLDEVRGRWGYVETKEAFAGFCAKWPQARVKLIENKANGPAIYSDFRSKTFGIILVDPEGSKLARAERHTSTAEAGQIWIPSEQLAPWITEWRHEMQHHPSEPNDRGDAASQAWDYLLPRQLADDPRTEERKERAKRQRLVKRVQQSQKMTWSRTGA